ncbi:MAG: acylphosphatase [Actinomycetia bacterium]|nr:acylphosphatase [Actinomycetes bacterium]
MSGVGPEPETVRVRTVVSGRVQGVWFRDSCRKAAIAAGVAGSTRNLPDGRVEAVFEGTSDAVEKMVAWCAEGPPRARVVRVETTPEIPRGEAGFSIR